LQSLKVIENKKHHGCENNKSKKFKMKILYNTYPMAFHTPGGGEIQLQSYYKYLNQRGVSVDLFDIWNPRLREYSLIHFFSCISGSIQFCEYVRSIGIPLLISPNLWITKETQHLFPLKEIRAQLLLATRIITNSNLESETLSMVLNIPRNRFSTIYNGVDDIFHHNVDAETFKMHFGIKSPFILNVGNIEPRKNQLNLVKAMKNLPDHKLVLIGHKRDENYANMCIELGGDQIKYIGPLQHDSSLLRSAYAGCSVFVLPSTLETPGLAALEAAAAGAKIVITAEGSTKEYFNDSAIYVHHNDVMGIAAGIQSALSKPSTAILKYNNHQIKNWPEIASNLEILYNEILETEKQNAVQVSEKLKVEHESREYYAWGQTLVKFKCRKGRLYLIIRAIDESEILVKHGGEDIGKKFNLNGEWREISIDIETDVGNQEIDIDIISYPKRDCINLIEMYSGVDIKSIEFIEGAAVDLDKMVRSSKDLSVTPLINSSGDLIEILKPNSNINCFGFYPVEWDGVDFFTWSRQHIELYLKDGVTSFMWRSINHARVSIIINDHLVYKDVDVMADWSMYSINTFSSYINNNVNRVEIVVQQVFGNDENDIRKLGVALKNISYREKTLVEKLIYSSSILKNQSIDNNLKKSIPYEFGLYPAEVDGSEIFVWSKESFEFVWPAGVLSFEWRAVCNAEIDMYINDNLIVQSLIITNQWARYEINIPMADTGVNISKISVHVRKSDVFDEGDHRKLGVALRSIYFHELSI
jgi:glycosyltransferase involved in cell wall biosynthesis